MIRKQVRVYPYISLFEALVIAGRGVIFSDAQAGLDLHEISRYLMGLHTNHRYRDWIKQCLVLECLFVVVRARLETE